MDDPDAIAPLSSDAQTCGISGTIGKFGPVGDVRMQNGSYRASERPKGLPDRDAGRNRPWEVEWVAYLITGMSAVDGASLPDFTRSYSSLTQPMLSLLRSIQRGNGVRRPCLSSSANSTTVSLRL